MELLQRFTSAGFPFAPGLLSLDGRGLSQPPRKRGVRVIIKKNYSHSKMARHNDFPRDPFPSVFEIVAFFFSIKYG